MNLHKLLTQRAANDNPVRIGLIGCGKFGTMFLTQALQTKGLHVVGIADLNTERAQHNLSTAGWDSSRRDAKSLNAAFQSGTTYVGDDAAALIAYERLDGIIEATGIPLGGSNVYFELAGFVGAYQQVLHDHLDFLDRFSEA